MGIKLRCKREEVTLTLESRNEPLQVVFEYWHTSSTQGTAKSALRPGKVREASFHAGEWSKDLSEETEDNSDGTDSDEDARDGSEKGGKKSPNNKRRREKDSDKEEPAAKLTKRQESRLCSTTAAQ